MLTQFNPTLFEEYSNKLSFAEYQHHCAQLQLIKLLKILIEVQISNNKAWYGYIQLETELNHDIDPHFDLNLDLDHAVDPYHYKYFTLALIRTIVTNMTMTKLMTMTMTFTLSLTFTYTLNLTLNQ